MIEHKKNNSIESIALTLNKDIIISLNTDSTYTYLSCGFNDLSSQFYTNDAVQSFAGFLSRYNIIPELTQIGRKTFGDIIKFEKKDHVYWGIVCYDLSDKLRNKTSVSIQECLNKVARETKNPVSFRLGKEVMNKEEDNSSLILGAIQKSIPRVTVYL
ncbi:MAG: hypothetical protein V4504_01070 [Patescibacteria group bacterium]